MQRCSKCRQLKEETDFEVYKNIRRKTCISCKDKRVGLHCDHGRVRGVCKECGGSSICVHKRRRSQCIECGGGSICIHKRRRSQCIECGGNSICIHKRQRTSCKECDGVSICIHKRRRAQCKECDGASICIHQRQRASCRECDGGSICIHKRQRSKCKECDGASICIHKRVRSTCKECEGASICIHQRQRSACKECSPELVIINLIRCQVRRCFNCSTLQKINHSIEYLGCDVDTLRLHIQSKMTADMTWGNIHYDHIKPVSRFDLDDENEFLKCCHFTNLQPLLAYDNLRLHNTWTEENEVFWNEHILYHPEFKTLYKV